MDALAGLAHTHGLKVHLDGARIFNAQAALGVSAARIAANCDSLTFCLSKGLACPIGSVICGTSDFINEARRWRKMVGGGLRQAGVLAAAGIVALNEMVDRLAEDHANAKRLADGIAECRYIESDPSVCQSDILYFKLSSASPHSPTAYSARLKERGVQVSSPGGGRFRAVTHYGISTSDVDTAVAAICEAAAP
jgi:threonine aldolase